MGEDVARCPSCSLHLHVVFDPGESRGKRESFSFQVSLNFRAFAHLFRLCSPLPTLFSKPPTTTTTADFAEFLPGASKQPSTEGGANKAVSVA